MESPFQARLSKGVLLGDGAMGTQLYERGVSYKRCFEEQTLSNPGLVAQIYREYLNAGAELIETNSFGANRIKLAAFGLQDKVRDINLRAVKQARDARETVGESAFVGGSIGPINHRMLPPGNITSEMMREAFAEQIAALLEGGADALVFETFTDLEELVLAIEAGRSVCKLPVVAQMTFTEEQQTLANQTPFEVARTLRDLHVEVIGVNCSIGPQGTLDIIKQMAVILDGDTRAQRPWLAAQPNAGLPGRIDGRYVYLSTPAYFADYAVRLAEAGVTLIGGCCGTTPAHIAAMAKALSEAGYIAPREVSTPAPSSSQAVPVIRVQQHAADEAVKRYERAVAASQELVLPTPKVAPEASGRTYKMLPPTGLQQKLEAGKFVISVEFDPPRGIQPNKMLRDAQMLKDQGIIDLINVADSPMARVRMSCLSMAHLIQDTTGIETLIHFATRDRNLMGLQSELLGAHAIGIRNVLALTGDPPRIGDYPNATAVWDVDSIGLISIMKRMNAGMDWAGNSIGKPAQFYIGCAALTNDNINTEMDRIQRKIEAGADFMMTQPLYEIGPLEEFLDKMEQYRLPKRPVMLGIMPVQSSKHAEYLHNEVPGITIPDHIRRSMAEAGENGMAEGVRIARELLLQARSLVQGVYLMPSFGRFEMVGEIVEVLRDTCVVESLKSV